MSDPIRYHLGKFPPADIHWEALVSLIGQANAALARYDGLVAAIPNASILLSPLTTQEAVLSSKIEGTNVTMSEVLEIEAGADAEVAQPKRDDAEEIINYRAALMFCSKELSDRRLTQNLLCQAHALLMQGVRGQEKDPGSYRKRQNWIGRDGCPIEKADYIPVATEHLQTGMDAWHNYLVGQNEPDKLVQLAVIHAEFEALHPFEDGNGRLGRMIIPLFLFERKVLSGPNFYMSGYLEANRDQYVENLRAISRDGAWTPWCIFFLKSLIEQASENQSKAQAILDLHRQMQRKIAELTHSQYASRIVDFLFSRPIFTSTQFIRELEIPPPTAQRFLSLLLRRDTDVLRTIRKGAGRRAAILAFPKLLNIAEGKPVL